MEVKATASIWHAGGYDANQKLVIANSSFDVVDPESSEGPKIFKYEIHGKDLLLFFDEIISVIKKPVLKSFSGKIFTYHSGAGSTTLRFTANKDFSYNDLKGLIIANDSHAFGSTASLKEREASFEIL
ncbi:MAG TPA: hypothetical protein VMT35_19435 [Ignavibacteriaceae bacterium]|nr:hypothetical protein [Ignavibacteriaceae bacterium]